ncbi:MAG: hypothetical protein O2954_03605 [bacterium]|nr:hypothetical protein [bacterium]
MKVLSRKAFRQASGKIRRFLFVRFRKEYISEQQELRVGECNQCGNCCEILFKCPFLVRQDDDLTFCSIYENRPGQCGAFPIDEKCLSEVDFDCTYSFAPETAQEAQPGTALLQIESD